MTTIRLSGAQATQLVDLLTAVAAAADTGDEDRYQHHYCRSQVRELTPPIEILVLAGVLREVPERPGPGPAVQDQCRWWSAYLNRLLDAASAATAAAIGQQPSSPTRRGPHALPFASQRSTPRLVERSRHVPHPSTRCRACPRQLTLAAGLALTLGAAVQPAAATSSVPPPVALGSTSSATSAPPTPTWPAPAPTRSASPRHRRVPTACPMGRGRSTSPRTARSARFLFEYEVLRLARAGGASLRFAIAPETRVVYGEPDMTGIRVGPNGRLYQLRSSRTAGVSIARYSLTPAPHAPPPPLLPPPPP